MTKVLVTGAGALLGQGIIRSLQRSAMKVEIVAVDPNPYSAGLFWAERGHLVPYARDSGYMARIRELLASERPQAVLVGTDVELAVFAEHREALEEEFATKILVSSPRVVAIADDKYLTFQFLRDAGFAFPESCLPGEEEKLIAKVGFPLVVKPRRGARSIGLSIVHDRAELAAAVSAAPGAVIQEHVGDSEQEYTAGVIVFPNQEIASIVMRRDLRDGNTYRAFVDDYPQLNAAVRQVAAVLQPFGPANFQFRIGKGGEVKVFEINARFSGTTPLRCHAGFNEVEMCLGHIMSGEAIVQPASRRLVILRHWSETVVSPSEVAAIR